MDNTLSIAVVGAVVTIVLAGIQFLTAWRSDRALARALEVKNERDDRLAAVLRSATQLVKVEVEKTAERLVKADSETKHALKAIHHLVNSNLTEVIATKLEALRGKLFSMNKFAALQRVHNIEPTEDEKLETARTQNEIEDLTMQLSHRVKSDNDASEDLLLNGLALRR